MSPQDYPAPEELCLNERAMTLSCGCIAPDDVRPDHDAEGCWTAQSNLYQAMERGHE